MRCNSMPQRCCAPPEPLWPCVTWAWFAFSHAINSFRFVAGTAVLLTIRRGPLITSATGSKSFTIVWERVDRGIDDELIGGAYGDRITVRRDARDAPNGDAAARTTDVFNHHRLSECRPHGLGQNARERIEQAARGIRYDHRDRTRGIDLRRGTPDRSQNCGQRDADRTGSLRTFHPTLHPTHGLLPRICWQLAVGSYWPLTRIRGAATGALLGAPVGHLGWRPAVRRGGVEIGHLVAVKREDAGLRAAGEVRECACFDVDRDHPRRLVDGVGPVIGDAALHHRIVLVRRAPHAVVGGEVRKIGPHDRDHETAVGVDHHGTSRIGAVRRRLIGARAGRERHERPRPDEPLLCRLADHIVLLEDKKRLGRAISESLAHHFAKMSQRSTFRHGAVAESGPTTLVSTSEKGAARQALAAEWGELEWGELVSCGFSTKNGQTRSPSP